VSIGEVLATARREAGMTIMQVSQRTRIRETIVRGIEQDDFSGCGADFYARGHIRAIARTVGVDPEPLVREYDSSHGAPQAGTAGHGASHAGTGAGAPQAGPAAGAPQAGPAAGASQPAGPVRSRERRRLSWSVALVVVLAAVAAVVIYRLVASGPARGAAAGARRPHVTAPRAARAHPAAKKTPAPPAAPSGAPDLTISLTAVREPCWVDLTTSGGATIFQSIVYPGTSKTWKQRRAVTLEIGNPAAITLTVNGKIRRGLGPEPVTMSLAPGQRTSG